MQSILVVGGGNQHVVTPTRRTPGWRPKWRTIGDPAEPVMNTAEATQNISVTTMRGRVEGSRYAGGAAFLGIPYAIAARFDPPDAYPPWTGKHDARHAGPAAYQLPSRLQQVMGPAPAAVSEDGCMTLNVWTPDVSASLPVLFWLHGGAWASGSGGWPWYNGAALAAEQGIVVVTSNYRLGPLGYLHLPEWNPPIANVGFLDQIAALLWVVDEISAFGGNPAKVTVGGQSAGAHAAALLASHDKTRPLVRRVLLQSGPLAWPLQTQADASDSAQRLFQELQISPTNADQLRRIAPLELIRAAQSVASRDRGFASITPPFQPVATDQLPWASPLNALETAANADLDILVGATREEMRAFFDFDSPVASADRSQAIVELDRQFGTGEWIYNLYEQGCTRREPTPGQVLSDVLGDAQFRCAALAVADHRETCGHPAYVYDFEWSAGPFGACHTIDLPFLFGTRHAWAGAPMLAGIGAKFEPISRSFRDAVGRFVRTGCPGWPPSTARDPVVMRFGPEGPVVDSNQDLINRRDLLLST